MIQIATVFLLLLSASSWSQSAAHPGSSDFDAEDRLAIQNLIHAYAFHWDSRNVEAFLSLFSDDAVSLTFAPEPREIGKIKDKSAVARANQRAAFFQKNQLQRRHIMSSTFFLNQTSNTAQVIQYCLLVTTDQSANLKASSNDAAEALIQSEIVSPIVYRFAFAKQDGTWRIKSRAISLDAPLDVP